MICQMMSLVTRLIAHTKPPQYRRTLQVALFIQYYRGISKSDTVSLNLSRISRELAINRSTASRALDQLEKVGLVQVQRLPGRKVVVTVIDGS